jgi:hypothetical protein
MDLPGGLAESAAETLVRLMVVESVGVDTGYIGRFAALGTAGDPRAVRSVEARLTDDARCLEASLSEIANVAPVELRAGLRPLSAAEVRSRWRELIEQVLVSGRVRPAELNAFVAEFADTSDDGERLLAAITELEECRKTMWHNTNRPTVLPPRDLERLRELDAKRRRIGDRIRSRYPVTVRADRVRTALERQYESRRAEAMAALEQCTSAEDRAGYAAALEQLDSAHELALRRQSVPQYGVQPGVQSEGPPQPVASGPVMAAAGQIQQSVLVQLEQQREQLVRMRDQDLTAEGRAAYDQAIAQLDVNLELTRRQHTQTAAAAEPAMTDEQHGVADQAMADVARATAQLADLQAVAGAAMEAASAWSANMITHQNQLSSLSAEAFAANEELSKTLKAMQNAEIAMGNARRSGIQADQRAATAHHEQARLRHAAAEARVAELQAGIQERHRQMGVRD